MRRRSVTGPSNGPMGWSVFARRVCSTLSNTLVWKNYRDEGRIKPVNNIWTNLKPSGFGEGNIYVVQTIADVVERCVLMATDPGDLVLDPTCFGTTAYVAERRGRRWITIDTSRVALAERDSASPGPTFSGLDASTELNE